MDDHRVLDGNSVARDHVLSAHRHAIDPVFLARDELRHRQFEAHRRELRHRLAQRTVVDDVGQRNRRRCQRVHRQVDDSSRLHVRARLNRLLQHNIGRQRLYVARVGDNDDEAHVVENALGILELLVLHAWHRQALAVVRIDVERVFHADHEQRSHNQHRQQVAPEVAALELSEKL